MGSTCACFAVSAHVHGCLLGIYCYKYTGIFFAQGDVMICMELMDMSLHDLRILVYERLRQAIPETVLGKIAESVSTCTLVWSCL